MKITPNQASYRPCFTAYEKTFVMLKPDAINRHLDSKIMDEIKSSGLTVLTQWNGTPTRSKMEGNYITHKDKSRTGLIFWFQVKLRQWFLGVKMLLPEQVH